MQQTGYQEEVLTGEGAGVCGEWGEYETFARFQTRQKGCINNGLKVAQKGQKAFQLVPKLNGTQYSHTNADL